ncbi:MAG: SoxR reducing system RseC family protein [Bacteroidales bacterium]|jgi:sigma-E factor negative regulatory protein RseC|nr:SoxR reducing system RseC family protein [Bacteroidales bacterium]
MEKHLIEQKGKVIAVSETEVSVKIERGEACAGCKNKASCQMGKAEEQIITVATKQANTYSVGEEVNISMKTSLGLKAVLYAYVLPLVLLLVAFVMAYQFIASELMQIVIALLPVIVYYIILYRMRYRMEKTFQFYISKTGFEN